MSFLIAFALIALSRMTFAGELLSSVNLPYYGFNCYGGQLFSGDSNFQCCYQYLYDPGAFQYRYYYYVVAYDMTTNLKVAQVDINTQQNCDELKISGNNLFARSQYGVSQLDITVVPSMSLTRFLSYSSASSMTLTSSSVVISTSNNNWIYTHSIQSGVLLHRYRQQEFTSGIHTVLYDLPSDTLFFSGYGVQRLYLIKPFANYSSSQIGGGLVASFSTLTSSYQSGNSLQYCRTSSGFLYCIEGQLVVKLSLLGEFKWSLSSQYQIPGSQQYAYAHVQDFEVGHDTNAVYIPVQYYDSFLGYHVYGVAIYDVTVASPNQPSYLDTVNSPQYQYVQSINYYGNGFLVASFGAHAYGTFSVINATVGEMMPSLVTSLSTLNINMSLSSKVIPNSWIPAISIASVSCSNVSWVDSTTLTCQPPIKVGTSLQMIIDFTPFRNPIEIVHLIGYQLPLIKSINRSLPSTKGGDLINMNVDNLGLVGIDPILVLIGGLNCTNVTQTTQRSLSCVAPQVPTPFNQTVNVTVGGQSSILGNIEFTPPVVFTNGVLSGFNTAGSETLRLIGKGFGYCKNAQCALIPVRITFGTYLCLSSQVINDTLIQCITPSGVGSGHQLKLELGASYTQVNVAATFNYRSPLINQIVPSNISAQLGGSVSIIGDQFGVTSGPQVQLSLISQADPSQVFVMGQSNSITQNNGQVSFSIATIQQISSVTQLQPGVYFVKVQAGNQVSNQQLTLNLVKQAPAVTDRYLSLQQGQSYPATSLGPGLDQFGSALTYIIVTLAQNGSVFGAGNVLVANSQTTLQTALVSYTPELYFFGVDFFSFQVQDLSSNLISKVAKMQFNVNLTNQAPFVSSFAKTISVLEDISTNLTLLFTDKDDTEWFFYIQSLPIKGQLLDPVLNVNITTVPYLIAGGTTSLNIVTYTPVLYEFGASYDTFSWSVQDPRGLQLSQPVTETINVLFVNHPPVVETAVASGAERTDIIVTLDAKDIDITQPLVFTIQSFPVNGSLFQSTSFGTRGDQFVLAGQQVTDALRRVIWAPYMTQYFSGLDTFTFQVSDGLTTVLAAAVVDVQFVNQVPVIAEAAMPQVLTFQANASSLNLQLNLFDPDEFKYFHLAFTQSPSRGNWFLNNLTSTVNFTGASIPVSNPTLIVQHDGKAAAYPYAQLTLFVSDSYDAQSDPLLVTVAVSCPIGQFPHVWSDIGDVCAVCPTGAECSSSGQQLPQNQAGFYPNTKSEFLPCQPASACPAATASGNFTCSPGYSSLKCGECVSRYYRSGNYCYECPDYSIPPAVMALILIAVLGILLYLVSLLKKYDLGFFGILVTYVQTISVFKSFNLQWPESVLQLFSIYSVFNFNIELTSPECYVTTAGSSYEFKFYITMAFPVALGGVVLLLLGFNLITHQLFNADLTDVAGKAVRLVYSITGSNAGLSTKNKKPQDADFEEDDIGQNGTFASRLCSIYLLSLQLVYLTVAQKAIQLHDCTYDGATGLYNFGPEPSRHCYIESWWMNLLPYSVLGMLLYVIAIPCAFWAVWYHRVRILKISPDQRKSWQNFILQISYKSKPTYKPEFDYWDSIIMLRKLLIVICNLFFVQFRAFQALLLILALLGAIVLQKRSPYAIPSLNLLENTTLVSSVVVLVVGVMFFVGNFDTAQNNVFGAIIIIIIVTCTLYILYTLFQHFRVMFTTMQNKRTMAKGDAIESKGLLTKRFKKMTDGGATTMVVERSRSISAEPDEIPSILNYFKPPETIKEVDTEDSAGSSGQQQELKSELPTKRFEDNVDATKRLDDIEGATVRLENVTTSENNSPHLTLSKLVKKQDVTDEENDQDSFMKRDSSINQKDADSKSLKSEASI